MTTTPHTSTRRIAKLAAVTALAGIAAMTFVSPASAAPQQASSVATYNTCPGTQCIVQAEIDTTGPTVKFRGATAYNTMGSQWFLRVLRDGVEVKRFASDYLTTNVLQADIGALPAGGAYERARSTRMTGRGITHRHFSLMASHLIDTLEHRGATPEDADLLTAWFALGRDAVVDP